MGNDKFIQPIDGIEVVHKDGPQTLLSPEIFRRANERIAAGENREKVVAELAMEIVELEDGLREDGLLPELEIPEDVLRAAGDYEGHPFHGNQWTEGHGVEITTSNVRVPNEKLLGKIQTILKAQPQWVQEKLGGVHLTSESGRNDLYALANTIHVGNEFPYERIPDVLPHEIGHALDWHDTVSQSKAFTTGFKTDAAAIKQLTEKELDRWGVKSIKYFLKDKKEAFAELFANTQGGHTSMFARHLGSGKQLSEFMPNAYRVVKEYVSGEGKVRVLESVRAAAANHAETLLHTAADKQQPKFSVAVRYAFAVGRKALKADPLKNVDKAVAAVAESLKTTLPKVLLQTLVAGGQAGATLLAPKLKAAGDVEGHPFHGNQWTTGEPHRGEPGSPERMVHIAWEHHQTWKQKEDKLKAIKAKRPEDVSWSRDWEADTKVHSIRQAEDEIEYFQEREQKALDSARQMRGASLRTAKDTRPVKLSFTFDVTQQSAVDWADRHAAELVTQISETTRDDINNAIAEALEGDGIDAAIDEILDAVGDKDRAELIAHQEVMTAVHEGQREAWSQAVDEGLLTGREEREWIVTGDGPPPIGKTCPICEGLEGKRAKLGESYKSDDGEFEGPPAHVRCRCTEGIAG